MPRSRKQIVTGAAALVACIAAAKLLVHLYAGRHYGYFVDELYYLACSRHLDWGYVDQPPLIALITWFTIHVFGQSLAAIHFLPAVAGAAEVALAAALARALGGGRFAQALAALATLAAPGILSLHNLLTMNAFEPLFWLACAWLVVRMIQTGDRKLWLWFGVAAGFGLQNKYSMAMFAAGLVLGLLLTAERRLLATRWLWIGGAIAFLIFLPNLLWNVQHHFPFLRVQAAIRSSGRDVPLGPLAFFVQEAFVMLPFSLPIWLAGLCFFFLPPGRRGTDKSSASSRPRRAGFQPAMPASLPAFLPDNPADPVSSPTRPGRPSHLLGGEDFPSGKPYRALGWAWLFTAVVIVALSPRIYYLFPAFPVLFAAGGVAWETWLDRPRLRWARFAYPALLLISGALLAPLAIPLLSARQYIRYSRALHLDQPKVETHRLGPLPQIFADQFGWEEMTAVVARTYNALPPEVRRETAILGQNYGQAGAIDFFGPQYGLPPAISGHQNYFLWGPRDYTGQSVIVIGVGRAPLERLFASVQKVGAVSHPYSMPHNHSDIFYCQGPSQPLREFWPRVKSWN